MARTEDRLLWTAGFTPARVDVPTLTRYVSFLANEHVIYLLEYRLPPLYALGIRYEPELNYEIEKRWWTPYHILQNGASDCKGLAAWRIAELRIAGEAAEPLVTEETSPEALRKMFHVRVLRADGREEDPSMILGLKGVA